MKIDFEKGGGLVPVIIQNADTGSVLMLGYMNETALAASRETGLVTFYSRSRQTLWCKGETSGNTLSIVDISVDCDRDTLLIRARPAGPTCHLGTSSCFGDDCAPAFGFLAELNTLIERRKSADSQNSYTAKLLQGDINRLAQKVGEEGVETVIAGLAQSDEALLNEAADLLYHLMVLLVARDLNLEDVVKTLKARHP